MGQVHTKKNKNKRNFDPKEEHFNKNGATLLEKRVALSQSQDIGAQQLRIFSAKEIENALDNYNDPALVLGSIYCFFEGTLDERRVVVRTPGEVEPNEERVDLVLTEVAVRMVLHQNNMMKIYGCCLETYIPLPVYEISQLSHPRSFKIRTCQSLLREPLEWNFRLRIASDTAYMLSYMHNALSNPVVHRNVTSQYVILDPSFQPRLVNVGYSVAITPGQRDRSSPVHGTPGYMDPEYIETKEVTEKCDVYSFGVLMLELLTGRDPIDMVRLGSDLANEFDSAVERNCMEEMIDVRVIDERNSDEIQEVAQLALACVAKRGVERPTMIDVVSKLQMIRNRDKT